MIRALLSPNGFRPGVTFTDAELAAIAQPTLMVFGTGDEAGTPAIWQRVTELIPGGRLALVDGAGHMPWLDDPERVAAEVRRFLGGATPTLAAAAP